jgi:hypothetical protein
MGQFAVIHITKGSGNGSALGNHIDRIETLDKSGNLKNNFNNADLERRNLNKEFVQDKFKNLSLAKCVSLRIAEGYKSSTKSGELKKIAKDAVKFVEINLTGSHERMKELESIPGELEKWIEGNYKFACQKYGENNIIRFTLHRDETTPHIHCVVVPITTDGRLSAKEIVGNRNDLKNLQDNYAQEMQCFGLERGLEGSLAKHTGKEDYIKKQNLAVKEIENLTINGLFGVDKDKTIKNLKSALIEAKTSLKMIASSQNSIKKQSSELKNQNLSLSQGLKQKEKEVAEVVKNANENYKKIVFNPEVFQNTKNLFEKIEKRKAEEKEKEALKQKNLEENREEKRKGFRR